MLPALRPYEPSDLEPLVECWYESWHSAFAPRRHPRSIDIWRRRFQQDYAGQAEIWLTATDRVAAFMVLYPEQRWLEQLFVHPQFQRQGLGRAMIALARVRCPQGLELDTPAENEAARRFYRRRGFTMRKAAFDQLTQQLILRYGVGLPT